MYQDSSEIVLFKSSSKSLNPPLGMVRNLRIVDNYVYLRLDIGSHQQQLPVEIQTALSSVAWYKKTYLCTIPGIKTTLAPSTGDAQITIVQQSPICGVILVTTPQEVPVALKAIFFS